MREAISECSTASNRYASSFLSTKLVAFLGVADGAGNPLEFVGIDVDEPQRRKSESEGEKLHPVIRLIAPESNAIVQRESTIKD
jgi:hypothetical protein